jgi:hypothetical protein
MELITLAGMLVLAIGVGLAGSRLVLWAVLCCLTGQIVSNANAAKDSIATRD